MLCVIHYWNAFTSPAVNPIHSPQEKCEGKVRWTVVDRVSPSVTKRTGKYCVSKGYEIVLLAGEWTAAHNLLWRPFRGDGSNSAWSKYPFLERLFRSILGIFHSYQCDFLAGRGTRRNSIQNSFYSLKNWKEKALKHIIFKVVRLD